MSSSADQIGREALTRGVRIGIAESLTGGHLSAALASGSDASDWYRGAVVAYAPEVKYDLLGVSRGPVNTELCAFELARGAMRVLHADLGVGVTGVGGPGPDEGIPAGTVFVSCVDRDEAEVARTLFLEGSPEQVVAQAVEEVLDLVRRCLTGQVGALATWADCHEPAAVAP